MRDGNTQRVTDAPKEGGGEAGVRNLRVGKEKMEAASLTALVGGVSAT